MQTREFFGACLRCFAIWERAVDDNADCVHCGGDVIVPFATKTIAGAFLDGYREEKIRQRVARELGVSENGVDNQER